MSDLSLLLGAIETITESVFIGLIDILSYIQMLYNHLSDDNFDFIFIYVTCMLYA